MPQPHASGILHTPFFSTISYYFIHPTIFSSNLATRDIEQGPTLLRHLVSQKNTFKFVELPLSSTYPLHVCFVNLC
jgi:hypothetical protein